MSESTAFGLGILFGVFGPLLLLPIIWAVARWPLRRLIGKWTEQHFGVASDFIRLVLSAALVGSVLLASYLPGRMEFSRLCAVHEPVIHEVTDVPGFYATELYPYLAEPFLRERGFAYVEAPDMYKEGRTLSYAVNPDGKTIVTEVSVPASRYAVSYTFRKPGNTIVISEKRIFELSTDRELARAGSVTYHGGYLSLLLGMYGMSDCPNGRTEKGARQFNDYYYLERKVLRSSFVQNK